MFAHNSSSFTDIGDAKISKETTAFKRSVEFIVDIQLFRIFWFILSYISKDHSI